MATPTAKQRAQRAAEKQNRPPTSPELSDLLEGLDDDSYVLEFSEWNASTGKWDYIEPMQPGEVRELGVLEFSRQRYTIPGAGTLKFQVRVRHRGGKYGQSRSYTVAGDPKPRADRAAAAAAATPAGASTVGASTWERMAFALGVPLMTALGTMLAKRLLEKPEPDPLLLELLRQANRVQRGESIDVVAFQKAITDAEARGEQRGRELGTLIERTEHQPEPGATTSGSIGAIVDGAVKPLLKTINRHLDVEEQRIKLRLIPKAGGSAAAARPTAVAGEAQLTPDSDATGASSSSSAAPAVDTSDELVQLLGQIPKPARLFLLAAADAGESVDVYVPLVVTKLSDEAYEDMGRLIGREDFLDVLLQVAPQFQRQRQWFADLVKGLREHFAQPVDEEDDSAGGAAATEGTKGAA